MAAAWHEIEQRLDAGETPGELALVRALRSPAFPRELVDRIVACRWVRTMKRALPLLLRHPGCPRTFALDVVGRLGWHDLLAVARDPRTGPAIRRQAERRLLERVGVLTAGELTTLARVAPRSVLVSLLERVDARSVTALLENPALIESDVVRMLAACTDSDCVTAAVRHARWGSAPAVREAGARNSALPLPLALGLLAGLGDGRLTALAHSADVPRAVRAAAGDLAASRREAREARSSCAPPRSP